MLPKSPLIFALKKIISLLCLLIISGILVAAYPLKENANSYYNVELGFQGIIGFQIDPLFTQTEFFYVLSACFLLLLIWSIYRFRLASNRGNATSDFVQVVSKLEEINSELERIRENTESKVVKFNTDQPEQKRAFKDIDKEVLPATENKREVIDGINNYIGPKVDFSDEFDVDDDWDCPVELLGRRVLIVDDNRTNRKILTYQAMKWGMLPEEAESGPMALEMLHTSVKNNEVFDMAILDLIMPGMDGVQLVRLIKADPTLSNIKLLMLTSYGNLEHKRITRESGVDAYATKPIRETELLSALLALVVPPKQHYDLSNLDKTDKILGHILVAEDDPISQKIVRIQLEKLGYLVDIVNNGLETLEAVKSAEYDLILMNCHMPEMDGYQATLEIRHNEIKEGKKTRVPIVAMTANVFHGEKTKCLKVGMDDYISKPIRPNDLKALLKRWVKNPKKLKST